MTTDWDADEQQQDFERAAVTAAQGWIKALIDLDAAYERIAELERQKRRLIDWLPRELSQERF